MVVDPVGVMVDRVGVVFDPIRDQGVDAYHNSTGLPCDELTLDA